MTTTKPNSPPSSSFSSSSPSPSASPSQSVLQLPPRDLLPPGWKRVPRIRYAPGLPPSCWYASPEGHIFDTRAQVDAYTAGIPAVTHFGVNVTKPRFGDSSFGSLDSDDVFFGANPPSDWYNDGPTSEDSSRSGNLTSGDTRHSAQKQRKSESKKASHNFYVPPISNDTKKDLKKEDAESDDDEIEEKQLLQQSQQKRPQRLKAGQSPQNFTEPPAKLPKVQRSPQSSSTSPSSSLSSSPSPPPLPSPPPSLPSRDHRDEPHEFLAPPHSQRYPDADSPREYIRSPPYQRQPPQPPRGYRDLLYGFSEPPFFLRYPDAGPSREYIRPPQYPVSYQDYYRDRHAPPECFASQRFYRDQLPSPPPLPPRLPPGYPMPPPPDYNRAPMMPPREMRPLPPPPQLTQLPPPPQMFFAGQLVQPSLRVPPPPPPLPPHSSFQPYYANRGDGYDRRNNDGDEDDDEDDEDRCEIPSSILEQAYISLADAVRGHIRRMASSRGNASRVPTVRFKHDVMMNSICDALHAIESEKGLFVEITPGSEAFEEVNTGLEELRYRRGTIVVLDRAWNIDSYPVRSRYYSIPPEKRGKEVLGFHSSKLSNLIGIAKEGFQVNTSEVSISTGKKEMLGRLVYTADLCRNAIKYSDEFTFCLVVTIFAGRVWETKEAMENMTVTKLRGSSFDTIHAIKVSLRGDMRAAPPERILPRQLLMFRKVRRPDLWTYIHYGLSASAASAAAAPTPNPTSTASSSPLTTTILQLKEYNRQQKRQQRQQLQQQQQQQQQPQQQQQQRQLPLPPVCPAVKKFVNKLINDTRIFWNAKLKNMWKGNPFDPVLALQTRDHVCFSSRNPASVVHLIAAPRARVRWSDMGPQSTIVVTKLYAFAVFVRAELQRVPQCPLLSILFPVCPSQDQLHCHILARSDMNARNMNLKYDNFVSAEVFIYNLAAGKYSDSWYSSKGVDPNDYYWGPSNNFT